MTRTIEVSDKTYKQLAELGGRLFSVSEVVARLVDEITSSKASESPSLISKDVGSVGARAPRARGATVEIDGKQLYVSSVPDLYEQALTLLINGGHADKIKARLPYSTSNKRYLISQKPKHPNGNDFFNPVKVASFYMEAHKNYETAIKQLAELLAKIGVPFRYIS